MMDAPRSGTGRQDTALLIWAFLQADCGSSEYRKELLSLGKELNLTRDINCNGPRINPMDDGDLETDGHHCSSISGLLNDMEPSAEIQWPRNREDAALQQVAQELREIAAELQYSAAVARATSNLRENISHSPSEQWRNHLIQEVEWVMKQSVGPELQKEKVIIALTLTLVRGVCEQAPRFLRNLFHTALHYIGPR